HLSWLDIDIDLTAIDLPPGTWRIVGMLPEITEEQAKPLVDKQRFIVNGPDLGFRNYAEGKYEWFGTALESLESAILAERYYLDTNPVTPYNERVNDWLAAEWLVLSRERLLLLGRWDG